MSKTELLVRYRLALLTAVATALLWANLGSSTAPDLVLASVRNDSDGHAAQASMLKGTTAIGLTAVIPERLQRATLEPAQRDPFERMRVSVPVVVQAAPVVPVVDATPVPPPRPSPPPLSVSFAGRMTTPDGGELVYVLYGGNSMALSPGQTLPNGYRVDAITAQAIEFSYPSLDATARLELPSPPKYEIR